jgi:FAD/FMN-containing dehydrogenase
MARDFGGVRNDRPSAVLRPGSAADISNMVGFARARHLTITPRGQGHSAYGQSQAAGGIIADMTALDMPLRLTDGGITVGAGATCATYCATASGTVNAPPSSPAISACRSAAPCQSEALAAAVMRTAPRSITFAACRSSPARAN